MNMNQEELCIPFHIQCQFLLPNKEANKKKKDRGGESQRKKRSPQPPAMLASTTIPSWIISAAAKSPHGRLQDQDH